MCPNCSTELPSGALSCPICHQLVHAAELQSLSVEARQAEAAGDLPRARAAWERVLSLLPPQTTQYTSVQAHVSELAARLAAAEERHQKSVWTERLGWLGAVVVFILTKGKLLLLGLTKLSTFTSMLVFFGLYWGLYGWKFAAGLALSLYIHEMGHVAALRRYGIAASAPLFIPGFGAFIQLRQRPATVGQDARVGLAGPLWGLGAAVAAAVAGLLTSSGIWFAIAEMGALINLFNFIPVWQLDGSRGFSALTAGQRKLVLVAAVALLMFSFNFPLLLVALGIGARLFSHDAPQKPDTGALIEFIGVLAALSLLAAWAGPFARPAP